VTEQDARAMLGTVDRQQVVHLLERLAARDARGIFERIAAMDQFAPDYAQVLGELAALLQKVALRQAVPELAADEIYPTEVLTAFAATMSAEDIQLAYQFAIVGRRDLDLAPDPRTGAEMTLLRMLAFRPAEPAAGARAHVSGPAAVPEGRPATQTASGAKGGDWPELLSQLELAGAARQLAGHCQLLSRDGNRFRFRLDARAQSLHTRQLEERFAQALGRLVGGPVEIEIEQGGAEDTPARREERSRDERLEKARASLENDPNVKTLRERFGAVLRPDSVKPVG
jgi:DNA polymerase-3 subunit gamma/tau